MTPPALASVGIIARHNRLGGFVRLILPVRARVRHVILGVRPLSVYQENAVNNKKCYEFL